MATHKVSSNGGALPPSGRLWITVVAADGRTAKAELPSTYIVEQRDGTRITVEQEKMLLGSLGWAVQYGTRKGTMDRVGSAKLSADEKIAAAAKRAAAAASGTIGERSTLSSEESALRVVLASIKFPEAKGTSKQRAFSGLESDRKWEITNGLRALAEKGHAKAQGWLKAAALLLKQRVVVDESIDV